MTRIKQQTQPLDITNQDIGLLTILLEDHIKVRGLAVACWTTDHYHLCLNLGVGISEGRFIF